MDIERFKGADRKRKEKWDECVATDACVRGKGVSYVHVYTPWRDRKKAAAAVRAAMRELRK